MLSLSHPTTNPDSRFMLQLCGHDLSHALAHRSLGRNRLCLGCIVLVPDEAFPSGRRRLPLGVTSGASPARQTKPVRYAVRTVSPDRRAVGTSLCSLAARVGRRTLLGNQFFPAGVRAHSPRLYQAPHFLGISVLGRHSHGAVVSHHRSQRILSVVASCHDGQTASRTARFPDTPEPSRHCSPASL